MEGTNINKHLDNAYKWLSKIPVSGASVDYMAMARQELREAFNLLLADAPDGGVKEDG